VGEEAPCLTISQACLPWPAAVAQVDERWQVSGFIGAETEDRGSRGGPARRDLRAGMGVQCISERGR
jgi:hypothetical protein